MPEREGSTQFGAGDQLRALAGEARLALSVPCRISWLTSRGSSTSECDRTPAGIEAVASRRVLRGCQRLRWRVASRSVTVAREVRRVPASSRMESVASARST